MSTPPDLDHLAPGACVGERVVEMRAGTGAHSVVYRARDPRDGALVALKVLRAGFTSDAELSALARVRHDRVVAFLGLERLGDRPVLVFEWMPGASLSADLARGPWPAARVESLARDLLLGLAAVHEAGVLHRDLKPSNALLDADGRAKLGDFGIASSVAGRESPTAGRIEGSPAYMAPEIVRGEPATVRSDLWSLGVLLFRALHGRLPFEGQTDVETFVAILKQRPVRPATPVEGLSPGLLDLVDRCLRKQPPHRPSSCAEALLVLDGRAVPAPLDDDDRPLGRDAELAELDAWTRSLADGPPSFVLLRGGEAVGLSTLLAAAGERARDRGVLWIPVALGSEGFLRPARRAALAALATRREPRSSDVEAAMRRLEPAAGSAPVVEAPAELVRDLEVVLRGAAGARPFVLAIDETHRGDADDLRRIDAIVRAVTRDRGTAIVAVRRPADGPVPLGHLATDPRARAIDVAPLAAPAVVEMLERDAGGRLDFEVASLLVERAGGDLRRARGLLAHLRAVGAVERLGGRFAGAPGWRDLAVLPTESERVRAIFDRLPASTRDLVEAAAVDAGEVDPSTLARVLGRDERDVVAAFGRLADRVFGFFAGAGAEFVFASAEVRDTVLAGIPPERRRAIHRAFVARLEGRADLERPDRIGLHLEGAGETARARDFLVRGANDAAGRYESRRLVDLARRAGISADGIRPPVTPDVVECALHVATSFGSLRRRGEREALLNALDAWAREAGADDVRHRITITVLAETMLDRNPTVDEVERLRRAVAAVRDPVAIARGHALLGRLAADDLRFGEAERELLEAIRISEDAGVSGFAAQAKDRLGSICFETGRAVEGDALLSSAIATHEARGNRGNAAISRFKLVMHRFDAEQSLAAPRVFLAEIDEIRHIGAEHAAAMARGELARVLRAAGDLGGALSHGERAIADLTRLGVLGSIGPVRLEHAAALLGVGDVDGAEVDLRVGLEFAGTDAATDADRRRAAAAEVLVALASGHVGRALAALERAVLPDARAPGFEDETIPILAEALLVAAPADAARAFAAIDGRWRRVSTSSRLVPRALVAAVRRLVGDPSGDDDAVGEALEAPFVREHHLVARVATLWAEARRLARSGRVDAAEACRAAALARAAAAGHVGLVESMRADAALA